MIGITTTLQHRFYNGTLLHPFVIYHGKVFSFIASNFETGIKRQEMKKQSVRLYNYELKYLKE